MMCRARGVSARFFCDCIELLDKLYPDRNANNPDMESFRAALERVERMYESFPKIKRSSDDEADSSG